MSLKNYNSWMELNESTSAKSFQYLEAYVNSGGNTKVVNYSDILNDKANALNEGAVLNEINFFEHLLDVLDKDAREVSKYTEDLVAILLKGSNSNNYGEADTIFSDVTMPNGEKVSVKSSKQVGFMKVLGSSRIKVNQIFSIIYSGGLSPVSDKEKDQYFIDLAAGIRPKVEPSGTYSIAACYKSGNDFVVEKTTAVSGKDLLTSFINNVDKLHGDNKGRLGAGDALQNILGFKPTETYTIKGISGSDIQKLAGERKIILKAIENLPTKDLRNIATEYRIK
jgi:hypothetical protein